MRERWIEWSVGRTLVPGGGTRRGQHRHAVRGGGHGGDHSHGRVGRRMGQRMGQFNKWVNERVRVKGWVSVSSQLESARVLIVSSSGCLPLTRWLPLLSSASRSLCRSGLDCARVVACVGRSDSHPEERRMPVVFISPTDLKEKKRS